MTAISFIDIARRAKISRIEIPILQRDYAQGRLSLETDRIRAAFLTVVRDTLVGSGTLHLDFVYGHIADGKLVPLDGQQRLTALVLLHWYVAARAGLDPSVAGDLPALTYETRHSSRRFCELIVHERPFPLAPKVSLSDWIRDQRWFASSWRSDPTIESMLVVLDALHSLFAEADCAAVWKRLVDEASPAITFDFLSVERLGLTDDLYIKMNSRGKPLTPFENFKAEFEAMVSDSGSDRYAELCARIDNQWTDIFWQLRGDDDEIDDAFLRYFRFVTDLSAARAGIDPDGDDLDRARAVYSETPQRLGFLFDAFNVWDGRNVGSWLRELFAQRKHEPGKVVLFDDVDLLRACATAYSGQAVATRAFPMWKLLMLFAVIEHLRHDTEDAPRRLRILRNLVLSSVNEMRQGDLPTLLEGASQLVIAGTLPATGFNRRQVGEEERKARVRAEKPAMAGVLDRLEDHPLLRGTVSAFDFDAPEIEARAAAFHDVFSLPAGLPVRGGKAALLSCGDYSQSTYQGRFQFGALTAESWREMLTREVKRTRRSLERLLDAVAGRTGPIQERLDAITSEYLTQQEAQRAFDWRYYLVKYPEMREGDSGLYVTSNAGPMGFRVCMLRKTQMNSYYRDPTLLAIYRRSDALDDADTPDPWFTGYPQYDRWLKMGRDGLAIRCDDAGLTVQPPGDESLSKAFEEVSAKFGLKRGFLSIPQTVRDGIAFDEEDRVLTGARLVNALVDMDRDGDE